MEETLTQLYLKKTVSMETLNTAWKEIVGGPKRSLENRLLDLRFV